MLATNLKRVLKGGFLNFRRNIWLSTVTVMVMALVLFVLGNLIFLGALAGTLLTSLESKIDISVYFMQDASEEKIMAMKQDLEALPDVAGVSYVSRETALADFRERHKDNALIADALNELGDNPLEASINIRAKDPTHYAAISDYLVKKNDPIVDKINYFENQLVIERLGSILSSTRSVGIVLALFLTFVAISVAFNTIRLVIYTMREEIGIMRLVGATAWFIRGPFLVSGLLYGGIAALVTTLLFFPLTWLATPKLTLLVPQFNLFDYFLANFIEFTGVLLAVGMLLGITSSSVAIRKYLKI